MSGTNFPVVRPSTADSIAAPTIGWADATCSTTEEYLQLNDVTDGTNTGVGWDGSYVTFEAEGDDIYVLFTSDAAETIATGASGTETAMTIGGVARDVLTTAAIDVPRTIYQGVPNPPMVIPKGKPILVYRTKSAATATLRMTRS